MPTATATAAKTKVTIYKSGMFGVVKTEATLVAHGRKKYAQYDAAPFVHFTPKGKRTPVGIVEGSTPFFLILAGWGHPDPAGALTPADAAGTQRSVYPSFDPRYELDFNRDLAAHLATAEIVADYRHTTEQSPSK